MQVQGVGGSSTSSSQVLRYSNPFQASKHMLRNEGILSFFKGVGAVVGGAPFASGLYFGGVTLTKKAFTDNKSLNINNASADFLSGVIGQLCGSLAWVPMDVIKERCQVEGQVKTVINYSNSRTALMGILQKEGILGLYRAYFIHQFTWAPFNGLYWMFYEKSKSSLINYTNGNITQTQNFLLSSTIAGAAASYLTSPLDLVKTRLQVMKSNPQLFDFSNPFDCAYKVWQKEGMMAFFDGVVARVLWLTPRYCIAVSLFDLMKHKYDAYKKDDNEDDINDSAIEMEDVKV